MTPQDFLETAAVFWAALPADLQSQFTPRELARHLWILSRSLAAVGNIRRD